MHFFMQLSHWVNACSSRSSAAAGGALLVSAFHFDFFDNITECAAHWSEKLPFCSKLDGCTKDMSPRRATATH